MNSKPSRRIIVRAVADMLLAQPEKQKHIMKELAAYLEVNKMTNETDLILNDLAREIAVRSGTMLVSVASARPLQDATRKELSKALREATGVKDIVLDETVDTSLIGGLIARTPDAELDLSIRTRLKQLSAIK